ncbi:Segregation and condensation protein B [bacterium HR24]|jgi:segregation and condensation protein B|nr:Segregation and condensation protein B [bacterium HR24]
MQEQEQQPPLKAVLEAILFVADGPVPVAVLAEIAGAGQEAVEAALQELAAECRGRGVRLLRHGQAAQMATAPETSAYIERFMGLSHPDRLSRAALETLAIIAYKQPVTRAEIEAIRGVGCERALASLKERGLVTEVGRAQRPGRPYLYGTTFRFLEHFGLERPEDLPPLAELASPGQDWYPRQGQGAEP